jgi:DNA-binding protein HU-beta/integration host factor subunit alpha
MNNKKFIAELSRQVHMNATQTQRLVDVLVASMGDHFLEGDTVGVPNFGGFEVKKKMERIMVNPSTGQRMLVPPKLVLTFKPSTMWKERVKTVGSEEDEKGGES